LVECAYPVKNPSKLEAPPGIVSGKYSCRFKIYFYFPFLPIGKKEKVEFYDHNGHHRHELEESGAKEANLFLTSPVESSL